MSEAQDDAGVLLDKAIAAGDVGGLLRAIEAIDAAAGPGQRAAAWLFPDGLALLWVRGGFAELMRAVRSPVTEKGAVYRVLNSRVRRLSGEELGQVVAVVGAPQRGARRMANLRAAIVGHPDGAVTAGLLAFIAQHAEGASLDASRFAGAKAAGRPWRGKGDALAVADAVAALGERRGPEVPAALIELLRQLPWGEDAMSTSALLEGLMRHPDPRCQAAVTEMMDHHSEPGTVRLMLLAAEHVLTPAVAKHRLLKDLQVPISPAVHWEYLLLLETWLMDQRRAGEDISQEALAEMRELVTQEWPLLMRVMYVVMLRRALPEHVELARAGVGVRVLAAMVGGFERMRMDARRHMWVVPALFAGMVLLSMVLNAALARPLLIWPVNTILVVAWLFVMIVTARTRFAAGESARRKLWYALAFWGVTGVMLASVVGTRVLARWG